MEADASMTVPPSTLARGARLGLVLALTVIAIFLVGFLARDYLSVDSMLDGRERLKSEIDSRPVFAIAAFALCYFGTVALSVPGVALLTLVGGFLFGPVTGGSIAILSATGGSVCVFLLARKSLGAIVGRKSSGRIASVAEGLRRDAVSYLLFARLMPLLPFWLVNVVAGASRIPLRTFILASLVGMTPMKFAVAFAGSALDDIAAARADAVAACRAAAEVNCPADLTVGAVLTPQMMSAIGALGLLALVPVALRRLRVHFRGRVLEGQAR